MKIKRRQGWEHKLIAYLRDCSEAGFRPGQLDCALFFAGGVKVMTGFDPGKELRGTYATIDDGLAKLKADGFADHIEYAASMFPEVPPLMAKRGDGAVLVDENGFPALGIVQGEAIYHMTLNGLGLRLLTEATRAFTV